MLALLFARRLARGALAALPGPALAVTGPPPLNDRGCALDPQVHLMLSILHGARRPTLDELGPERGRVEMERLAMLADPPPAPLHRVEDQRIPGPDADEIPIRLYVPRGGPDALPALIWYHGGGFVLGNLETHDSLCRRLALHAGAIVIAVDYRLAPEHPFPAAVEDACAAFRWIRDHAAAFHVDPGRIAVGGDSAGGNLAAVVCQQVKQAGEPLPAFQLLAYPATDLTRSADSHRTFAEGYFLTEQLMDWFVANYLTDPSEEKDPRGSPLATRDLAGLPPAHVVVAGFDPLRDEGEAYADALAAAGVPTSLRNHESLIHGFVTMGGLVDAARHAVDDFAEVLRRRFWG